MKYVKSTLVICLVFLVIFYMGAYLITGEFILSKMDSEIRKTVFGLWIAFSILASVGYAAFEQTESD